MSEKTMEIVAYIVNYLKQKDLSCEQALIALEHTQDFIKRVMKDLPLNHVNLEITEGGK